MFKTMKRIILLLMLFPILLNCDPQTPSEDSFLPIGEVVSLKKNDSNSVVITCSNGRIKLSFQAENIIRVHAAPKSKKFAVDDLYIANNGPYHILSYDPLSNVSVFVVEKKDYWLVKGGQLKVHVSKSPCRFNFFGPDGKLLFQEPAVGGLGYQWDKEEFELSGKPGLFRARFERMDDEHFFGLGGLAGGERCINRPLDKTGISSDLTAREGGFESPFYYSTRGYGLFFANIGPTVSVSLKQLCEFVGTYDGSAGKDLDYYVIYGPSFERILHGYVELTGKPLLPEKWFFGLLMSNYAWGSPAAIRNAATRFREGDWPLDALIEDYAWRGNGNVAWRYEAKDVDLMLRHLDHLGVRLGLHVNGANFFDVTNPEEIFYNWSKYDTITGQGVGFWWQDQSEGGKVNGFSDSLFGTLWAKVLVEGMARHNLSVPVISRCASVGGHRYISPWGGDIKYPLKNIKSDLSFIRDAGLVGYAAAGSDMGGFSNNRDDKIIFRRVIQQFLVFPVIRPHGKEGSKPPWTVSKRAQEMWRFYCKLRYRLHPYIYSAAIEAHQIGRPILAPLVFDYQHDPKTYNADFDFLFGRQILVAPVVKNASRRRLYLPEGNWIHYWTGKIHKGGKKITVRAPLTNKNGLPMFIKEGSIIPMIPEMNRIYETSPNPLTLDIYPLRSGTSSYRLLDSQTPFSPVTETRYFCTVEPDRILIQIENSSNGHIMLIHNPRKAVVVSAGGKELPALSNLEAFSRASEGWFSGKGLFPGSPEIKTINVKLNGSPSSNQSISIEF